MTIELRGPDINVPRSYILATPPMRRLYETVSGWIHSNLPGGFICGESRAGKTFAIEELTSLLRNKLGEPIYSHVYAANRSTVSTDKKLWTDLLYSINHDLAGRGDAVQKFWRLVAFFSDRAHENSTRQVVLFIDNAEDYSFRNFGFLKSLYNSLLKAGVNPCIISIGAPEFGQRVQTFEGPEAPHLKGRFFIDYHEFTGLQRPDDLRPVLGQYDRADQLTKLGAKLSTKLFVPEAFQGGFRLESNANLLWEEFQTVRPNRHSSWPMQYFTETVRYLLVEELAGRDNANLILPSEIVQLAIQRSRLPASGS